MYLTLNLSSLPIPHMLYHSYLSNQSCSSLTLHLPSLHSVLNPSSAYLTHLCDRLYSDTPLQSVPTQLLSVYLLVLAYSYRDPSPISSFVPQLLDIYLTI